MRTVAALLCALWAVRAGGTDRQPVWIDTDPAMGEPERDVDDGLALIQAFHSPELDVRGVSVVFGNAPLDRGLPIARRVVNDFGPPGLRVYSGAAAASRAETDASRALAAALRTTPMTILALGPMTNVATVLQRHPELARRIVRVIAVAGRRPGQRFTTGTTNKQGHRDFNFELDPRAFQVLLDSPVEVVLAPFEISSKIWIDTNDLDRLEATGSPMARAIVAPSRAWLALWTRLFGVSGFNPFDTLAVAYAASPVGFTCEKLPARIDTLADDVTEPGVQGVRVDRKPYLLVAKDLDRTPARVTYCSSAPPGFKQQLLSRLAGSASVNPRLDAYGALLRQHVRPPQVDYRSLKADRAALDAVARSFAAVASTEEQQWPRDQRIAYWINAYNLFTLQAIVDHYPIANRWFTLQPRNSIRQIDGVWTTLTWQAAGRTITLDGIEHGILRPEFGDPRIHFAINCASVGCPPLAEEPYRAVDLNAQLDFAARRYLASPQGLRLDGDTIRVSSIFKWYGQDFTQRFNALGTSRTDPIERAILGVVAQFGPAEAAAVARSPRARVGFLDYDWSLNDVR